MNNQLDFSDQLLSGLRTISRRTIILFWSMVECLNAAATQLGRLPLKGLIVPVLASLPIILVGGIFVWLIVAKHYFVAAILLIMLGGCGLVVGSIAALVINAEKRKRQEAEYAAWWAAKWQSMSHEQRIEWLLMNQQQQLNHLTNTVTKGLQIYTIDKLF